MSPLLLLIHTFLPCIFKPSPFISNSSMHILLRPILPFYNWSSSPPFNHLYFLHKLFTPLSLNDCQTTLKYLFSSIPLYQSSLHLHKIPFYIFFMHSFIVLSSFVQSSMSHLSYICVHCSHHHILSRYILLSNNYYLFIYFFFFSQGVYKMDHLAHITLDEADTLLDDSFNDKLTHYITRQPVSKRHLNTTHRILASLYNLILAVV